MFKVLCLCLGFVALVAGHGRMMDPPNRSSLWRFDNTAPPNYEDDELYCGGYGTQWDINGGKCGVCGDVYTDAHPQKNENTGKFGRGKIVATYKSGSIINTEIILTTNHWGNFQYHLCEIKDSSKPESGEECFKLLTFADGTTKYTIDNSSKFNNQIQLPKGFTCKHCTLRWTYTVANSWGVCEDGSEGMGCGPQEQFRSCSDITIV